jgi:hypothetical protein
MAVVTERIPTRSAERVTTVPSPLDRPGGPDLEWRAALTPRFGQRSVSWSRS